MKKVFVFASIILCLIHLAACGKADITPPPVTCYPSAVEDEDTLLTVQELNELFNKNNEENWQIIDSVVFSDKAYDAVGAVLFTPQEHDCTKIAFVDPDGHFQLCGFDAIPAIDPDLEYVGKGVIKFMLQDPETGNYEMKLSFTRTGSNVNFKAEAAEK